uniref:Uncharacterized protein n=1 Tax=Megaselia scalaris TaxID=36166 RepID=T1GNB3_MEGSC
MAAGIMDGTTAGTMEVDGSLVYYFGNWQHGAKFLAFIMNTEIDTHTIHPIELLSSTLEKRSERKHPLLLKELCFRLGQSGAFTELCFSPLEGTKRPDTWPDMEDMT